MKNGETYALDMAGAQYGWHESVTPWQLYNTSRVRGIKDVLPFGGTRVFCKTRADNMGGQRKWIHTIKENFAESVDNAMAKWQRSNVSSSDLLRLPEHEFQKEQASLLNAVDDFLHRRKVCQEAHDIFNVSEGFKHGIYDREFTSSALGSVSPEGGATLSDGLIAGARKTPDG